MKLAIIGLEKSGKTAVFNALTGQNKKVDTYGKIEAHIASIKVPDERIEWLTSLYKPKKTAYASIEFIDIPGNINDSEDAKIIAATREAEALIFTVRAFDDPSIPHPLNSINPLRDFAQISTGLIVSDMAIGEKRLERLKVSVLKPTDKQEEEKIELASLQKIMENLEAEKPAKEASLTEKDEKAIRSFQFLTLKPYLALINISEKDINAKEINDLLSKIDNSLALSAKIEMEISQLDEGDRKSFLDDIGVKELSLKPFIQKAYSTLGLISFFTVGEDEVRAWTIKANTTALKAAGKIHSDLERGFIRAEVFSYDDIRKLGDEKAVKSAGKFRLEGKDYIVHDGDIINIKFSV